MSLRWMVVFAAWTIGPSLLPGCSEPGKGVASPTDRRTEELPLGEMPVTVETAVYEGRVVLPAGHPARVDSLTVWSALGGAVPVARDGRFRIRMNTDATSLALVRDPEETTTLLGIFAASPDLADREMLLDVRSTAGALVFMQPLVALGHPVLDALLLEAIGELPEVRALADVLTRRLPVVPGALDAGDPGIAAALATALDALVAAMQPEEGGAKTASTDISNDNFADVDGIESDEVQFRRFDLDAERRQADAGGLNHLPRWVFYHLDRADDLTNTMFLSLAGLAPARQVKVPGIAEFLARVAREVGARIWRDRSAAALRALPQIVVQIVSERLGAREVSFGMDVSGARDWRLRAYSLGNDIGSNLSRDLPPAAVTFFSSLIWPGVEWLLGVRGLDTLWAAGSGLIGQWPPVCWAKIAVADGMAGRILDAARRIPRSGATAGDYWSLVRTAFAEISTFLRRPDLGQLAQEQGCGTLRSFLQWNLDLGFEKLVSHLAGTAVGLIDGWGVGGVNYALAVGGYFYVLFGKPAHDEYRIFLCDRSCDRDGDGAYDVSRPGCQCLPADCDDTQAAIKPGRAEACNGRDDNCNGWTDEGLTQPCATPCGAGIRTCIAGTYGACSARAPSAESCDGLDNDCNGAVDEGCSCRVGETQSCYSGRPGTEGVAHCRGGTQTCVAGAWGACVGEVLPSADECDGVDNDCSGAADDWGVCGPPVVDAPLSGVVPGAFSYTGGSFRVSVTPLDAAGNMITGGVTASNFFFSPVRVADYATGAFVTGATAVVDAIDIVAGTPGAGVDVVLSIDSSGSMRSTDPARLRVDAARRFIARLGPADRAAVIDFGAGVSGGLTASRLLAGFTSDQTVLNAAVGMVVQDGMTPLYDSITDACDMLARARTTAGFVLVLTDGDDTASTGPPDIAVARAVARCLGIGARVFTVGLGRETGLVILQDIAGRTGGAYAEAADAFALAVLFDGIGAGMTRGRVVVHGTGTFDTPIRSAGRYGVAGSLYTVLGGATAQTPFSFSVEIR
ncbi:MAG: MopE-related protein [Myxococcota bacterium]|nr:MopE-related protein [Myxococcota bacterium]